MSGLRFMENNLLNSPLVTVRFLSDKIFESMLNQLEKYQESFFEMFYIIIAVMAVFAVILIGFSFKYLSVKTNVASILINIEQNDIESRRLQLNTIQSLLQENEAKEWNPAASTKKQLSIQKSEAREKFSNSKKIKTVSRTAQYFPFNFRNPQHRRSRNANLDGLSLNINLIVLSCVVAEVFLMSFQISNQEEIKSNYSHSTILITRMKILFQRASLHSFLGVSMVGLYNTDDFRIMNQPAEPIIQSSLDQYRKYDSIYDAFLKTRYSANDKTFEYLNSLNFCTLFIQNPCFDPELTASGWLHFEGGYADIVNRVYSAYLAAKGDRKKLESSYDSYNFLFMEAALSR